MIAINAALWKKVRALVIIKPELIFEGTIRLQASKQIYKLPTRINVILHLYWFMQHFLISLSTF